MCGGRLLLANLLAVLSYVACLLAIFGCLHNIIDAAVRRQATMDTVVQRYTEYVAIEMQRYVLAEDGDAPNGTAAPPVELTVDEQADIAVQHDIFVRYAVGFVACLVVGALLESTMQSILLR